VYDHCPLQSDSQIPVSLASRIYSTPPTIIGPLQGPLPVKAAGEADGAETATLPKGADRGGQPLGLGEAGTTGD
jgi:hypothetical protein